MKAEDSTSSQRLRAALRVLPLVTTLTLLSAACLGGNEGGDGAGGTLAEGTEGQLPPLEEPEGGEEGDGLGTGTPKMMTVGLHCRIIGKPGRFAELKRFVEYVSSKEGVWVATRGEIARAWVKERPYKVGQL